MYGNSRREAHFICISLSAQTDLINQSPLGKLRFTRGGKLLKMWGQRLEGVSLRPLDWEGDPLIGETGRAMYNRFVNLSLPTCLSTFQSPVGLQMRLSLHGGSADSDDTIPLDFGGCPVILSRK
jgi:hypothetical protein